MVLLATGMEGDAAFDRTCNYTVRRVGVESVPINSAWTSSRLRATRYARRSKKKKSTLSCPICSTGGGAWLSSRLLGVPVCVFVYGKELSPHEPKIQRLNIVHALKRSEQVFCISEFTRQCVLDLGTSAERTALVPPGLTDEFIEAAGGDGSEQAAVLRRRYGLGVRPVIMTLSHLGRRKGIDKTVEAMALVVRSVPEAVYVIAGEGPMDRNPHYHQSADQAINPAYGASIACAIARAVKELAMQP